MSTPEMVRFSMCMAMDHKRYYKGHIGTDIWCSVLHHPVETTPVKAPQNTPVLDDAVFPEGV
jgi:hypothetical protein